MAILGYAGMLFGIAVTGWAQAVNPYFEPGVRIQSERHQRVIDTGPYRFVRHLGYIAALFLVLRHGIGVGLVLGARFRCIGSALLAGNIR